MVGKSAWVRREQGGSRKEWGRWRSGFSILFWYFSVVLSFLSFLFSLLSLRGWRHGYQGSLGTDNMAQTMASSPTWWWESRGVRGRQRGGVGQGHREREGKNGALVYRARTLYSITPLALSLSLAPSHTHSLILHTHHFSLTLLNEVQRHLHWKQHRSLKLDLSLYRPAQGFLSSRKTKYTNPNSRNQSNKYQ